MSETYDIIFAGGGAAACITAGRLAEADPSLKILILEAGPHSKDVQEHVQPARFFSSLILPRETFSFHVGKATEKLANRNPIVPSGRCVGGGSAVNFVVYTRAAASDYDDWETVHGNKGWGSKHLIPLLRKAETYQGISTNNTHGSSGPLKISFARSEINVASEFLTSAIEYDKTRGHIDDLNALYACNGYGRWARYVDQESGKRSDTAHHYVYSQGDNKNLTVYDRKRVVRVIFEGKRAAGVEYVDDKVKQIGGVQTPTVALASKLVVISGGAFGSPAILERSGIGSPEILRRNDVQQIVDLPGVGENYMDHNVMFPHFHAAEYAHTMDPIFRGSEDEVKPYATRWLETGQGLMSHNGIDGGIKLRPSAADLEEIGPTFKERWSNYFANAPDKPVMLVAVLAGYAGLDPKVPHGKYFSTANFSGYPASLGRLHITSGQSPYAPLDFETGFLEDEGDLHILRWAYKHGREIARRMPMYRGEVTSDHPKFPEGSAAAAGPIDGPVAIDASPIRYTEADNKAIDDYHRQFVNTTWHSCGTCAMKARDNGGVVDERLNVYGVESLKVADLSIIPGNVGGNTYNTAIAIGEKAAVIIAQDIGIKGVTESD